MSKKPIDLLEVRRIRQALEELSAKHPELTGAEAQERLGAFLEDEHTTEQERARFKAQLDKVLAEHLDEDHGTDDGQTTKEDEDSD